MPIWHGALTAKDSEKIERVQKIVLKFLLRHKYSSYTEACKEFGISKLAQRREKLCLKFALKEYKKSSSIFMKVPRSDKRPPRRVAKKNVVIVPKSRTQRHQRSSFVYLSKLLNEYHNGWKWWYDAFVTFIVQLIMLTKICYFRDIEHEFHFCRTYPLRNMQIILKHKNNDSLFPIMIVSWSHVYKQKDADHEDSTWWVVLFQLCYPET